MKIKYILIFVLCFFCLSVNVRATSIDFTCEYKNGNDTLKLIMSGDYDKGVSVSYALIINDASSIKFYPANFIQYFDNSYQILEGAGYVSGKYYTYACPKELYVAANNNNFVYQIVKYSYDLINGKYITAYTPIIFFSENGYKIEDGNITKTVVLLDEPITSNVLNIDSYSTKTFSINSANSKNNTLVVPPSESDTENLQYCYYKNSCGEIIELKFYKNGNINQRNFSDGKKLMNWDNKNICPTSVKKLNENDSGYYGYSSSCSGSGSVKLCYDFLESSSNKKNIITEGNCSGLTDNSNDKTTKYVSYNSDDAPYIKVVISGNTYEYLYENKSSSSYTNVTFTTSNADGTINKSDAESHIKSGDYPKYIVCTDVYKNCRFSSEKGDGTKAGGETTYININYIGSIVGLGEKSVIETCEELIGDTFIDFLKNNIFKVLYIIIPIILIVLTTFDFAKAVFSENKDGLQKAFKMFIRRVIASILILLVPTILIFVTNIFGNSDVKKCVEIFQNSASE